MKLSPQQKQLIELLADGAWHCTVSEQFMKDDRARISELRKLGFVFDESGKICDRHNHGSKLKLRRLISFPDGFLAQDSARSEVLEAPLYQTYTKAVTPQAQAFLEKWKPKEEVKQPQQTLL